MNLTEQLDNIREGDIARAEFDNSDACEGRVVVGTDGRMYLHDTSLDSPRITRLAILRRLLQPGDRVIVDGGGDAEDVTHVSDGGLSVRVSGVGWIGAARCERLPAEPPQPECPFPIGAKVRSKARPTEVAGTVTDWVPNPVKGFAPYLVVLDSGVKWAPNHLELVPQAEPIAVGSWWADASGLPHVVIDVGSTVAIMRPWDDGDLTRGAEVATASLRRHWTRLDGPPEPPVGSVVAVRVSGTDAWRVASRESFNGGVDGWWIAGRTFRWTWDEVLDGCDTGSLRVLAMLDGE